MNKEAIKDHMVVYIEEKEKESARNKFMHGNSNKSDIVNAILDELNKVVNDENK